MCINVNNYIKTTWSKLLINYLSALWSIFAGWSYIQYKIVIWSWQIVFKQQLLGKETAHQPVLGGPLVSCHRGHQQQGEDEGWEEGGVHRPGQDPKSLLKEQQAERSLSKLLNPKSGQGIELSTPLQKLSVHASLKIECTRLSENWDKWMQLSHRLNICCYRICSLVGIAMCNSELPCKTQDTYSW